MKIIFLFLVISLFNLILLIQHHNFLFYTRDSKISQS